MRVGSGAPSDSSEGVKPEVEDPMGAARGNLHGGDHAPLEVQPLRHALLHPIRAADGILQAVVDGSGGLRAAARRRRAWAARGGRRPAPRRSCGPPPGRGHGRRRVMAVDQEPRDPTAADHAAAEAGHPHRGAPLGQAQLGPRRIRADHPRAHPLDQAPPRVRPVARSSPARRGSSIRLSSSPTRTWPPARTDAAT